MKKIQMLFVVSLLIFSATAFAGGYTIQTPGQMPSYATPNIGGGYTIQTPGKMPTYINPQ